MSNTAVRLITGFIGAAIILAILYLAPVWAYVILATAAAFVATWEFFNLTHPGDKLGQLHGTALTMAFYGLLVWTNFGHHHAPAVVWFATLIAPVSLLLTLLRPSEIPTALPRTAALTLGPAYLGATMAMMALIRSHGTNVQGAGLVLLTMMFAWMSDTGGYFAGRFIGGPKLYPKVSPNKTWAGSIGGLTAVVLGAVLAHFTFLPALPLGKGVLLAFVGGAVGQMGDLAESVLKRSAGVKDSGGILPGHGGILDRIDALVFCAVAMFVALESGWLGI
ncbi:MAG: phosphatidate cytidylyltransferase [Polyangiales bacterium]